jgi:hypothetical protein
VDVERSDASVCQVDVEAGIHASADVEHIGNAQPGPQRRVLGDVADPCELAIGRCAGDLNQSRSSGAAVPRRC